MDAELQAEITKQIARLCDELDRRTAEHERILPYCERAPSRMVIPEVITAARREKSWRYLMGMSEANWGKLVVASKLDRLEVNGITSPDKAVSLAVWENVWQENKLGLDARLATDAALTDGRSHATVWPSGMWLTDDDTGEFAGGSDGGPVVRFDDCTTMIVEYEDGSRQERVAAMRRWVDDDDAVFVTLFRREGIYKFQAVKDSHKGSGVFAGGGRRWAPREVRGEAWPLRNPLGVVPVVELGVNRKLAPGRFTACRGEFANDTGMLDRVNLLTYLGLVLAVSMSFPLRLLIGEPIIRDDDGKVEAPFDAYIGGIAQMENPEASIAEYKAADRSALSIYDELAQFATSTTTPRHYFPSHGVIANVSAETIMAFEGPMHAQVRGSHQPSLGDGFEEVLRLGGLMLPQPVKLSRRAEISWANHESRSLAEKASAFAQLGGEGGMPLEARAELALGMGQDAIARLMDQARDSDFAKIVAAATAPATAPPPAVPAAA